MQVLYRTTAAYDGHQLVNASERQIIVIQLMLNRVVDYQNTEQRSRTPPLRSGDRSREAVETVMYINIQAEPIMSWCPEGRFMSNIFRDEPVNEERMYRN